MATATKAQKQSTKAAANGKGNPEALKKAQEARQRASAKRQAEKEAERKEAIASGALIADGDVEFREVKERAKDTIDQRSAAVIERLRASDSPVVVKELHEELGGAYALLIPVFSTLLALGLVKRYRRSTGERGGSGIAYLWIG